MVPCELVCYLGRRGWAEKEVFPGGEEHMQEAREGQGKGRPPRKGGQGQLLGRWVGASEGVLRGRSSQIWREGRAPLSWTVAWGSPNALLLFYSVLHTRTLCKFALCLCPFAVGWAALGKQLVSAGSCAACLWASSHLYSRPSARTTCQALLATPLASAGESGEGLLGGGGPGKGRSSRPQAGVEIQKALPGPVCWDLLQPLTPHGSHAPCFSACHSSVYLHKPETQGSTLTLPSPSSPWEFVVQPGHFYHHNIPQGPVSPSIPRCCHLRNTALRELPPGPSLLGPPARPTERRGLQVGLGPSHASCTSTSGAANHCSRLLSGLQPRELFETRI